MMTLDLLSFCCVKLYNPNPSYNFVAAGLDSYEGNDIESLILRVDEIGDLAIN